MVGEVVGELCRKTTKTDDEDGLRAKYPFELDPCQFSSVPALSETSLKRRQVLLDMLAGNTNFKNKIKSIARKHEDAAPAANDFVVEHKDFLTSDSETATSEVISDAKNVLSTFKSYTSSSNCQVTSDKRGLSATAGAECLADRLESLRNRLDEVQGMTFEEMKVHLLLKVPDEFILRGNAPNPFSTTTTIRYGLKKPTKVTVEVYDVTGRRVRTLVDKHQAAGFHRVQFSADGLSSGAYIYRVTTSTAKESGRMTVVR